LDGHTVDVPERKRRFDRGSMQGGKPASRRGYAVPDWRRRVESDSLGPFLSRGPPDPGFGPCRSPFAKNRRVEARRTRQGGNLVGQALRGGVGPDSVHGSQ